MATKFRFRKFADNEPGKCWYDNEPTYFALENLKTGEQCFSCINCSLKYGKFTKLMRKSISTKSLKINQKLLSKWKKNEVSGGSQTSLLGVFL